jgi:hypothetical protein
MIFDHITQSALKSASMVKNVFILTRIWHFGLHVRRGRLKSKAVKYYVEDRVNKNKNGSWTYN